MWHSFYIRWALCWLLAAIGVAACTSKLRTGRFVFKPPAGTAPVAAQPQAAPGSCMDWSGYLPHPAHPEYLPMRYLRINVHVLDNSTGTAHRPKDSVRVFIRQMLDYANAELDTNAFNWRAPEGTLVLPKRYCYRLSPQPGLPGDDGIYFHYDDSLVYFVSMGENQNNYDRRVIQQYGIGADSIVNIFLLVHHPDSMRSKTYRANGQGIALGTALKMAGVLESREGPRSFDGLLNHEIGHILGLSHAWTQDGCPDTDDHPNKCWDWAPDPPCRDQATNNMMDYNAYQLALTPCQVGRVQAVFANETSPVRRCLQPRWCAIQDGQQVTIADSVSWTGARDLEGDLTIAAGGSLRLSCRVSMPAGSRITVQPGGRLWLDGCRLHNACGLSWKGIFMEEKNGVRGQLTVVRPPQIENTED